MSSDGLRLLGFDVRLSPAEYLNSQWKQERRGVYLLGPSVDWPLSVDSYVWPSAFFAKAYGAKSMIPIDADAEYYGYWLDLLAMKAAFERGWEGAGPGIPIAVSLYRGEELTSDQFGSRVLETHPTPRECPEGTQFLGYDVADSGLISGLSNCGYSPEEGIAWAEEWRQHLNDHGLLKSLDAAVRFAKATDGRVPEHAPFYVFGLSRLPEQG